MSYYKQVMIILFSGILFCTLGVLQENYRAIALENNQLYTNAYTQKGTVIHILETSSEPTNVFQALGPDIRAFQSTNYENVNFPIYEGERFKGANTLEALVGAKVPTVSIDEQEYVEFADKYYHVIGKLGRIEESNLYMTTIVNDLNLFHDDEVLIVDTNFTKPLFNLFSTQQNNFGARDGSESFFVNATWFTLALLIGAGSVIVLLFYRQLNTENQILFLSGESKSALLLKDLKKICLVIGTTLFIILVAIGYVVSPQVQFEFVVFSLVYLSFSLLLYVWIAWRLEEQTYGILS